MSILTRWEDPTRPTVREAVRDAFVRAVLPAIPLFVVIVAIGLVIMKPLDGFKAENSVNTWLAARRTSTGNAVTQVMSMIGNTEYVIAVGILVALVVLWRTHKWWYAVIPLLAISVQATVFVIATAVVGRSRPPVERLDPAPPTSSYPSGHVGASTALYVSFALMATRIQNVVARRVIVVLCIIVPFLVSFARLYRGAHHVTDVIMGAVNGVVCALLAWGYLRRDAHAVAERPDGADDRRAQSRA
ncbi:phosphatase PAP2 family protein [Nostocoides sp. Soil756]|jgi:undecaprenyl-diphosphatase|uniref:phosphatase PAP2 family protein n=1 Tax=Nostocoides sp. Soil756 TaxID=1736399 RepID=UPI0006FD7039|nr:phosphatase PAP2 family protein [Tetrasphaera sp. Soil756]KRE63443.1 phospholipid phosphatase [Tetrasphaera sp. Soil756]